MKKYFILLFIQMIFLANSEESVPNLFGLNWGMSVNEVQNVITNKSNNLEPLKHYPIFAGRNEGEDIRLSSNVKYQSSGITFYNIPGNIIFSFYNPDNMKSKLILSKIEIYLSTKDNTKLPINVRVTYKNLIIKFCDNYKIELSFDRQKIIFSKYNYQVSINGVTVHFIANIGDNILNSNESIYINYENNYLQNQILKKEMDLSKIP